MRLLVLGGSGGVGRHVVRLAVERGYAVRAVVRAATPFTPPAAVEVLRDDVLREGALAEAAVGVDAVVSSLGLQRRSLNPWSALISPTDLCSRSARLLVAAMRASGVSRVVAVSSAGVGDSFPRMNGLMQVLVRSSNLGPAYADLAKMEEVLRESGLDWTCLRPTRLTDGALTKSSRVVDAFGAMDAISRADVAFALLEAAARPGGAPRTPQLTA